jgi:hypothetical protein
MSEPRDACRPVALPSGETIPVLGGREPDEREAEMIGEVVDAVRRLAAQNPPEPGCEALYARIEAARGPLNWRQVAAEAGVKFSVLFRVGQGRMPGAVELAAIETWLESPPT